MSDKSVKIDINVGGAASHTPEIQTHVQAPGEIIQHPAWDERDGPVERELKRLDAEGTAPCWPATRRRSAA